MDRSFSAAAIVEIEKRWNRPAHLLEAALDSGTLYLTDYFRDIEYGGNTYTALGWFLGFDGIEESARTQVNRVTISLSAIPPEMKALILDEEFLGREVVIYKLLARSGAAALVEGPIFQGEMDEPFIDEDPDSGKATASISAASFDDFAQRRGRHTNHEEQQLHFAGDEGFILSTKQQEKVLWGRKA